MPYIEYVPRTFAPGSEIIIERADTIARSYAAQGYDLTLRQCYYQFVARGWLANRQTEYKRLGSILNDARLAGRLDWDHIVDRTRAMEQTNHWADPSAVINAAARGYANDKWAYQRFRPEVWVEKEALVGVIERAARAEDVPWFACRGYVSQSELWSAAKRLEAGIDAGQRPVIYHLGDHDPSGIDMTRDMRDRLSTFLRGDGYDEEAFTMERIALNMDQVRALNPPPNPAKLTDSRVGGYLRAYGGQSWELDALDPPVLAALIAAAIKPLRDETKWQASIDAEAEGTRLLEEARDRWDEVAEYLA